ncbi:MAG: hypothetical protein EOP82_01225 [Variovorax sp.]|nr:MAG: hypothetical protein EOP82_01225 [Variovorax sp.]
MRHLPHLQQPSFLGLQRTFAHDPQHNTVLDRVLLARRVTGRSHPDVFARKILGGALHQVAPGRRQLRVVSLVNQRQEPEEFLASLVHEGQVERESVESIQGSHVISFDTDDTRLPAAGEPPLDVAQRLINRFAHITCMACSASQRPPHEGWRLGGRLSEPGLQSCARRRRMLVSDASPAERALSG